MARAISVKIPVATMLKDSEDALARLKSESENKDAVMAEYVIRYNAWLHSVFTSVADTIKFDTDTVSLGYKYNDSSNFIDIKVKFDSKLNDSKPIKPDFLGGYQYEEAVKSLESAIFLLKKTEQTEVSTSTYGAIIQYLR
jgi:hypothetical protein